MTLAAEELPPPVSAPEALRLLDDMIRIAGVFHGRGKLAITMQVLRRWMQQIRPHLAAAALRSNDR